MWNTSTSPAWAPLVSHRQFEHGTRCLVKGKINDDIAGRERIDEGVTRIDPRGDSVARSLCRGGDGLAHASLGADDADGEGHVFRLAGATGPGRAPFGRRAGAD